MHLFKKITYGVALKWTKSFFSYGETIVPIYSFLFFCSPTSWARIFQDFINRWMDSQWQVFRAKMKDIQRKELETWIGKAIWKVSFTWRSLFRLPVDLDLNLTSSIRLRSFLNKNWKPIACVQLKSGLRNVLK